MLQPFSMEPRNAFVARFLVNRDMKEIFPGLGGRIDMAEQVFRARWAEAQVTVTKADGEQFFID